MPIRETLIRRGLVNEVDIGAALDRQRTEGGELGDNLVALGRLTDAQLANVKDAAPPVPVDLESTGSPPATFSGCC